MALKKTNGTVSTTRGGTATNTHIRVFIMSPTPENISPEGVQISTTLLANPGTSWKTGDVVTFEVIDGHGDLDQTIRREVLSAGRDPGVTPASMPVQKAVIVIYLRGTLQ